MTPNTANPPLPGAMPGRTPENAQAPADFKPLDVAKSLLRATRTGTLATLDRIRGYPFASLVNIATDVDGAPLILVSRLATHTANLECDGRASLLLAETGKGDALAHPRLTVLGTFEPVAREGADDPRIRRRFLSRHPKSELYAGFGDFAFWRMSVVSAHLNGGFARAADLSAADVLTDVSDARTLVEAEADAIAHMNADHAEALKLYASKLLGARDGDWRCVGLDPDGIELQFGQTALRLAFPQRVTGPGPLRAVLKQLAEQARAG
jgi:putative heme iron utilization protein